MNLKERNFLKLMDFTPEEITYMIDLAADLKAKKKQGIPHNSLTGKNIAYRIDDYFRFFVGIVTNELGKVLKAQ